MLQEILEEEQDERLLELDQIEDVEGENDQGNTKSIVPLKRTMSSTPALQIDMSEVFIPLYLNIPNAMSNSNDRRVE
ncbi:5497_t:CDS:2, partial [Ambispora gerdemannii]